MLVLTRKTAEKITIGDNITITVLRVKGGAVKLGIDAPRDIRVLRSELPVEDRESEAATEAPALPVASAASAEPGELPPAIARRLLGTERARERATDPNCRAAHTSLRALVAATRRRPCATA